QVGDVRGFRIGALDTADHEVEGAGDVGGVFALAGGVLAAEQGQGGDAGVGHVGRIRDVGAFNAAAVTVRAPAAALTPAALGGLLADQVGEPFVDSVVEWFGDHALGTSGTRVEEAADGSACRY